MKIELEINKGRIADLLCCAFEGGSNYWCFGNNIQGIGTDESPTIIWQELDGWNDNFPNCIVYPHCLYPLFDGGKYQVTEMCDDDPNKTHILNLLKIKSGLKIMAEKYPRHFGDWLAENDDATTGDVFLQCCLFGEVKYG